MLLAVCFTLLALWFVYFLASEIFSPLKSIATPGWPLIGVLPRFYGEKDTMRVLAEMCETYFKEGMFLMKTLMVSHRQAVVLTNPEYAKTVLSKPDLFQRSNFVSQFIHSMRGGLVDVKGDVHRLHKRILSKAFTMPKMRDYLPVVEKHADVCIQELKFEIGEKSTSVEVASFFNRFSFDVIGELGFGMHFNSQINKQSHIVHESFEYMVSVLDDMKSRLALFIFPFLIRTNIGMFGKINKHNEICASFLDDILLKRYKKIAENDMTDTEQRDLLSMMITAADDETDTKMTDYNVKQNAYTFLIAGQETTAKSLAWLAYSFAKYPKHTKRAQEEIDGKLKHSNDLTVEDLSDLPFTNCLIKESMRHYAVVGMNHRVPNKNVELGGYTIPKGTPLFMPMFHYNTNCDYGESFNPERYFKKDVATTGTSFVFGYGPYSCIGKNLAMLEMRCLAVKLLQNFDFQLSDGYTEYKRRIMMTVLSVPEIKVNLSPRQT